MHKSLIFALVFALALAPQAFGAAMNARAEKETGDAWADLGNWKRAKTHYEKALKLDPGMDEARMRLANGLYRLGDREGALSHLAVLQRKNPKSPAVAAAAGVIWLGSGKPARACDMFVKALAADPDHGRSMYGSGQCHHALYDRTKKVPEKKAAMKHYQAYLRRHPKGPHALSAREAWNELRLGEVGAQVAEAKESLAAGKYRLAARTLREVVRKKPDLAEAYYLLGLALASPVIDRIEEAVEAWEKAPDVAEARLQLGIVAYEDDRPADARDHLQRAVELAPEFAEPHYHLGLVYTEMIDEQGRDDNLAKARKAFSRVVALAPKTRMAERASSKLQVLTGQVLYLSESEVIDTATEVELGRKLTEQIEKRFGVLDDERLQARLNRILRRIAAHSERLAGVLPYKIRVLEVDGINALSFTGGTIYLYKGLLDFVRVEMDDSDDALAAVIGHEVVHVDRRHGLGMLDLVGGARQLMEGRSLNVRSLNKLMKGISRRHEYEADLLGILYAYRAGFNPASAYRFHRRMIATGREVPDGLDHPTHLERAGRLKEYLLGLRAKARHFDRGVRCIDEGEYEDAIQHLEIFLGLFPHNLPARNNLGVAMHRLAMEKRVGEHQYKLSTSIDPRSKIPKVGPVRGAKKAFSPDRALMIEAAELFREILLRRPGYRSARTNLGACLLALGENDQARKAFEQALSASPASPQAQNNLAVARLLAGDAKGGMRLLKELISKHPAFADAYFNLARAMKDAKDTHGARKMYLAYLAREKKSGWAGVAREELKKLR